MMTNAVLALVLVTFVVHAHGQTLIYTEGGFVQGKTITANGKSIDEFLSIPFAEPPIGDLRFKRPEPPRKWTGTLNATQPSAGCIQYLFDQDPRDIRYQGENYSEDCLHLNIWKPSYAGENTNLPVMIWIYGGGLQQGLKDVPLYNGAFLAGYDVVVVTMNYRVGLLGFGFVEDGITPGNVGLLDQLEAMKWVKNNIWEFGGDSEQITLFGESAGSWSVGLHLLSPLSRGYFNKVIMQSGAPIEKLYEVVYTHEKANHNAKIFTEFLGCPAFSNWDIYNCFMTATPEEITEASNRFIAVGGDFMPVIDNHFLPEDPLDLLDKGYFGDTKMLIGAMKDEITIFLLLYLDPYTLRTYENNATMSFDYLNTLLRYTLKIDDTRISTLRKFYESMMHDAGVMEVANRLGSDVMFNCAIKYFASSVSKSTDVYFYEIQHRASILSYLPEWLGAPHSFDIDLMFGHPFNTSRYYNGNDRIVSQSMMTAWTNFAKTGNPNVPTSLTTEWPRFDPGNLTYMLLDTDLTTRDGYKRHECAFVNKIMPLISGHDDSQPPPSCAWPRTSGSGALRQDVAVVAAITAVVLLVTKSL